MGVVSQLIWETACPGGQEYNQLLLSMFHFVYKLTGKFAHR